MRELYREALYFVNHLDSRQWLIVAAVALVLGILCMRGLGSRSSY